MRVLDDDPDDNGSASEGSRMFSCRRQVFCTESTNISDELETRRNIKKLTIVCVLCFMFMIAEILGGILSSSLALISDAMHMFSDIAGFAISLVAIFVTRKQATRRHSYGFHRAEVIGAIFSVALIWTVTAFLIKEAIDRINKPGDVDGLMMLAVASSGLVINIIMAFILHRKTNQIYTKGILLNTSDNIQEEEAIHFKKPLSRKSSLYKNLNIRSAFLHVIGDLIQSIGVVIAALVIYFKPSYHIADPICTFMFSGIVLFTTWKLLKDAVHVLMEGSPLHIDQTLLEQDLNNINGIHGIHDLHIWSLSSAKITLTCHLFVHMNDFFSKKDNPSLDDIERTYNQILSDCHEMLYEKYDIRHSTIQLEFGSQIENIHRVSESTPTMNIITD